MRLLFLVLLISFSLCSQGQDRNSSNSDNASGIIRRPDNLGFLAEYGFVLPHRPHMKSLIKGHSPGFRLHAEWNASGFEDWHHLYNIPAMGVEYQFLDLGNQEQLGNSHALFYYLRLPLTRKLKHQSQIRMGIGMGYLTKKYDIIENGKNLAAGSHLNGSVFLHYQHSFRLKGNIWLNPGFGLTHFSNAAFQVPNLGLNIVTAHVGLSWMNPQFQEEPKNFDAILELKNPETRLITSASFGLNENFPPGGAKFGAYNIGLEFDYGVGFKSGVSARADLFYSEAVFADMQERSDETVNSSDAVQFGVAAGYGLYFGAMLVQLQTGFYLIDQYNKNGSIYNRFALQQQISDHLIINLGLKTHFAKAQNFELGLGWKW